MILNLCDINDEAENLYYEELLKYFPDSQIVSLKYDPKVHPGEMMLELMCDRYDLIVGHGFGGLLALIIGRATKTRTILINPMYPASRYWSEFLPDFEYQSFLESITENDICFDISGLTTANVFLILGRDDDLIDTATTDKYFTKGNSFYVEGGHSPSGEDFVQKFGELAGVLKKDGEEEEDPVKITPEEKKGLETLHKFFYEHKKAGIIYLHTFANDFITLSEISRKYLHSLEETEGLRCLWIPADSLPVNGTGVRRHFSETDFLIIDKIVHPVLGDEIRRSLWIACDEVISHGGKVLLLSDEHAADLFEDDREMMDLIYTGIIQEAEFYLFKQGRGIRFESGGSDDTRPFDDYYRTVVIDEIRTDYGNLAIRWHSPELSERWLYLYYKDDQWFYDSNDGWCSASQAKAVLRAAVDPFTDSAKNTDHDAHEFFGWGW